MLATAHAHRAVACMQGRMHLAWDYLHMVADNGNVALLELRERIYNTGSAQIPQDAPPPVLPYQQESVVAQAPQAGKACLACDFRMDIVRPLVLHEEVVNVVLLVFAVDIDTGCSDGDCAADGI